MIAQKMISRVVKSHRSTLSAYVTMYALYTLCALYAHTFTTAVEEKEAAPRCSALAASRPLASQGPE